MTTRRLARLSIMFVIVVSVGPLIATALWIRQSSPGEIIDPRYVRFMQTADAGRKTEALELGDSLFNALLEANPDDSALILLTRRLEAAKQIRTLIAGRVRSDQTVFVEGIAGMDDLGLPPATPQDRAGADTLLPPAREVYWTRLKAFTTLPNSEGLSDQQRRFCDRYCDLRMQDSIMEIGRQVILTDPDSSEHVCYAVVLPLLHLHGRDDAWNQMEPLLSLFSPEMLDVLSRFALLQVERPQAAMALAQYRARAMEERFTLVGWALDAADACTKNHRPDLVEALLRKVTTDMKAPDAIAQLRLAIANSYARCGDCATAALRCERTLVDLPKTSLYGRITVAYLGYLAREENAEQVIARTEVALDDPRCEAYLTQILYLRWWALHKANRLEEAALTAQRLTEQFPENPCIAPVLLERAIDALAHQEYNDCREWLTKLTRDFPGTESAERAQDILARLDGSGVE